MATQNTRLSAYQAEPEGVYGQARDCVQQAYQQSEDLVRHNPASSALVTFGVGLGLGLMMTMLLAPAPRRRQTWYESHMPDWMSRDRLSDAAHRILPQQISRRIG